jgi:hypothetical protein
MEVGMRVNPQDLIQVERANGATGHGINLVKWSERKERSDLLLARIEDYMSTHRLPATFLSKHAVKNVNFIADMRKGCVALHRTMDMMEKFLDENPNGIAYKGRVSTDDYIGYDAIMAQRFERMDANAFIVDRDPCFQCGVRKDIGCQHHPKSEPVALREALAA